MTIKKWLGVAMLGAWFPPVFAACERVAQAAGAAYQSDDTLAASSTQLNRYQALDHLGIWSIYRDPAWQFEQCAPIRRDGVMLYPVLRKSNGYAVINGIWVIKTYRESDVHRLAKRHDLILLSGLPNRFSAVFQSPDVDSYDRLLERLDRDKDIERVVPVLVESGVR